MYDIVAAIRDSTNWNYVFDNTAPGAGTAGFGPEARVRDQLWRYQTQPANRTADDTSEYMMGKVLVNVVLPASTGANSTEAWTVQEITDIEREVAEGAGWWATTLPDAHLSFHIDTTYADNPISTTREPISQTPANDYLWMNDMLTVLAPGITGTTDERLQAYTDLTRRASGSDWAFTVFVVDDTNDADHAFAGSGAWFAYADLGGPVVVMTYHNDGWGIDSMGMVFAHETAHIFYALDEYSGSGDRYTDHSGYLNIQNLNAVDGNPHPETIVDSLMGEPDRQRKAFANHASSLTSLQMVGYRDSDSDHIPDILATPPSIATTILAQDVVAGSLAAAPDPVIRGANLTLTAANVTDADDLPTGDGVEGGDAVFYVGSLRGDTDLDRAVAAADKAAFMTKWAAKDPDADFRGIGFGVRPPDGKITLGDIDGFTSVFLAAQAAGRSLATLPAEHPLSGDVAPLPVLGAPAHNVDVLSEAAGKVPPGPVLPGGGSPAGAPLTAAGASAATLPGGSSGDPLKVRQALAPSAEDASDAVLRV